MHQLREDGLPTLTKVIEGAKRVIRKVTVNVPKLTKMSDSNRVPSGECLQG